MPVLNEMTKLYIGAAPVTKVFAGDAFIWPNVGVVTEARTEGTNKYLIIVDSNISPFDCDTAGSQYAYRLFQPPYDWTAFAAWDGCIEAGTSTGINIAEKKLVLSPLGLGTTKYEIRRQYKGQWSSFLIDNPNSSTENIVPESFYNSITWCGGFGPGGC